MLTLTLTLPELPLTAEQFGELPDPEGFRLELTDEVPRAVTLGWLG